MSVPPHRTPGSLGHVADHNLISDELTTLDAAVSSLQHSLSSTIYVAPGDDLVAAFALAASTSTDLVFLPGTYTVPSAGLTWDCTRHSVLGIGMVILDATALTSGYAITLKGNSGRASSTYDFTQALHRMQGIRLNGPDSDSTLVDGFLVADVGTGSRGNSHVNFVNLYVFGFRDQFFLGDNTWCVRWVNCFLNHGHRYGLNCDANTNAGENYTWLGGTIAGVKNASGTGVAVYSPDYANADIYFFGTSFDYCDIMVDWRSGIVTATGCHFEGNNAANPMVKLSYTGGQAHTTFSMFGGTLAPTEVATTRASLIDCMTASGAINIDLVGVKYGTYGKKPDIVRLVAGSGPKVRIRGGDLDGNAGAMQSLPCLGTNRLFNGNWAIAGWAGWTHGGTVSYTTSTTTITNGNAQSALLAGTGTPGGTQGYQQISCKPGSTMYYRLFAASDSVTAGNVQLQTRFYSSDNTYNISTNTFVTISGNQGWTEYRGSVAVPAGAAFARMEFVATDLNGNVYLSDAYLDLVD